MSRPVAVAMGHRPAGVRPWDLLSWQRIARGMWTGLEAVRPAGSRWPSSPTGRSRCGCSRRRWCGWGPQGWVHAVLVVLASAALALWAGDEVLRGVNRFRRLLGVAMLAWLGFALVRLGW